MHSILLVSKLLTCFRFNLSLTLSVTQRKKKRRRKKKRIRKEERGKKEGKREGGQLERNEINIPIIVRIYIYQNIISIPSFICI